MAIPKYNTLLFSKYMRVYIYPYHEASSTRDSPPRHIQLHRFLRPVQQPQRPLPVARAGAQRCGEGDAVHVFREEGDGLDDEIVVFGLF